MRVRAVEIALVSIGLQLSCRPAARPAPLPAASTREMKAAELKPRATTVLTKDYGARGTLRVEMRETFDSDGGTWREVAYSFQLVPPGGGAARELSHVVLPVEPPALAAGEPSLVVLDAELTADDQLVDVCFTPPQFGGRTYSADVISLEGAAHDVPPTAYRHELYATAAPEPHRLRARITGTIAGNDLTVSLTGDDHVAMRFRFENFHEGRIGWYLLPGGNPPPAADYLAPKLSVPAK